MSIESRNGRPEQQSIAGEAPAASKSNWFTQKRMNRARWWTVLVAIGLVVVVSQGQSIAFAICALASLPILILISIRRLHDIDKSAWWLVPFWLAPLILDVASEYLDATRAVTVSLLFATLILQAWGLFEFGFRPGTSGPNRFGPDPLYTAGDSQRARQFGFTKRVVAVLVVGLIVAFPSLFRQLRIASNSQMPTLLAGDHVFYSNFERGYPRQDVRHGDMVAFRLPKDKSTIYSERVVGLPGDRIQMIDGHLHLNGAPVKRERVDDFIDAESGSQQPIKRWRETLPNGVSYETLDLQDYGFLDNTPVYTVPAGRFFAMGDNRDNSTDSRVLSAVGYVPFRQSRRPGSVHLVLGRLRRACLAYLELAMVGAMESAIHNRQMMHGEGRYAAEALLPACRHPAAGGTGAQGRR